MGKSRRRGNKKLGRSARNRASGKFKRAYDRCVKRTGRWRGKKVR